MYAGVNAKLASLFIAWNGVSPGIINVEFPAVSSTSISRSEPISLKIVEFGSCPCCP